MARINYENKENLNKNPDVLDINKVNDTDMNSIKRSINQEGSYIQMSPGITAGYYFCDAEGELTTGMCYKFKFPVISASSNNMYISVNAGTTYFPVTREVDSTNIKGKTLNNQYVELYFNGTSFIYNNSLKKRIYFNQDGTTSDITLSETSDNFYQLEITLGKDQCGTNTVVYNPGIGVSFLSFVQGQNGDATETIQLVINQLLVSGTKISKQSNRIVNFYGKTVGDNSRENLVEIYQVIGIR